MPNGNGILVVDDNANIRHLLRVFVETNGFKVCGEAENGADAIEKAKQLQPDLVLLDLTMPTMDGEQTFSELRRLRALRVELFSEGFPFQLLTVDCEL